MADRDALPALPPARLFGAPKPTLLSLFAGGGIAALGIAAAGFEPIGAVEYNPFPKYGPEHLIAEWYAKNVSKAVICRPVQEVDYRQFQGVTKVQASPPCPNFSVAKAGAEETADDLAVAGAVARCIREARPKFFVLENVSAYRKSKSFRLICNALDECGYMWACSLENAADYGVPQTRIRLILRAVHEGMVPALPTPVKPWRGWYAAVEDLLPLCPESAFAPWQLARLPKELRESFAIDCKINQSNDSATCRESKNPIFTLTANQHKQPIRAYLCGVQGEAGELARVYPPPAPTLTANHSAAKYRAVLVENRQNAREATRSVASEPSVSINTDHTESHQMKAWQEQGRVVSMTPQCLARFQTIPDWYELPEKPSTACRLIGNAAPALMMQKIAESLVSGATLEASLW